MAKEKVRVGVIGVGYVAVNNFLPVLPRMDDVEAVSYTHLQCSAGGFPRQSCRRI